VVDVRRNRVNFDRVDANQYEFTPRWRQKFIGQVRQHHCGSKVTDDCQVRGRPAQNWIGFIVMNALDVDRLQHVCREPQFRGHQQAKVKLRMLAGFSV